MAFLGNLVRSFLSSEVASGNTVLDVSINNYAHIPVYAREDCLVLYGPTNALNYELLLQKPLHNSMTSAFSLFRVSDLGESQCRFQTLKGILVPLVQVIPQDILILSTLQKICDTALENSTWSVAHIASKFSYVQAFSHPDISSMADVAEIKEKLTPLHISIKNSDIKMAKVLMDLEVSVDVCDNLGNSVFHFASTTNKQIIELVTSRESKLLDSANLSGKTPLHLACESDKPECVKALLVAGADVNVATSGSAASLPIHSAIDANSTLCVKEIIEMYPNQLNAADMKNGGTPLHWATSKDMINALIEFGCRINAGNFHGSTALHNMVHHNRLPCVLELLSWSTEVNLSNKDGDSALHLASTPALLQALLVYGADTSMLNNKKENVRHLVAVSSHKKKNQMIFILHCVGAPRCARKSASCNDGCSPMGLYNGEPPEVTPVSRYRTQYDEFLDETLNGLQRMPPDRNVNSDTAKGGRILCLDGGGVKGLVLIQLLMFIEKAAGVPLKNLFDWICGTSTGGILALALAMGKSPKYCQGLYFRLKDRVFVGLRPYSEKPLEAILKKEFGEDTRMADVKGVKVFVTGVLADRFPADLHLFRNYESGEDILGHTECENDDSEFHPTLDTHNQLVWEAARASGAAPSYFSAFGRFLDGGLIANNPTLDALTEVAEYNAVLRCVGREEEAKPVRAVLSLGTGRTPVSKVNAIDVFHPETLFKTIKMAFGLTNMVKLLVDQATMADNRTVDRARAWCSSIGVPYLRLTPQLSVDVQLDETRDEVLVNMLWETMVYANSKKNKIDQIVSLLKFHSPVINENEDVIVLD